jgi:hypothetical protein
MRQRRSTYERPYSDNVTSPGTPNTSTITDQAHGVSGQSVSLVLPVLATSAGCLGVAADGFGYLCLGFQAFDASESLAETYAPTNPAAAIHLGLMAGTAASLWLAWRLFPRAHLRQWSAATFVLTIVGAAVVPVWYGIELLRWSP